VTKSVTRVRNDLSTLGASKTFPLLRFGVGAPSGRKDDSWRLTPWLGDDSLAEVAKPPKFRGA